MAAADAGEVDLLYESLGDFVDIMDAIGWERSEAVTANTVVVANQTQLAEIDGRQPYGDARVRRALAMASLERGLPRTRLCRTAAKVAENHHVCPIHPEYAELPPPVFDPRTGSLRCWPRRACPISSTN